MQAVAELEKKGYNPEVGAWLCVFFWGEGAGVTGDVSVQAPK
jgi:hypothetical protein